jgi:hypothetical protein
MEKVILPVLPACFVKLAACQKNGMHPTEAYRMLLQPLLRWIKQETGIKHFRWRAICDENADLFFFVGFAGIVHPGNLKRRWNFLQRVAFAQAKVFDLPTTTVDIFLAENQNDFDQGMKIYFGTDETPKNETI